jgi:DNA-binding NarL/FixJ family response regulator
VELQKRISMMEPYLIVLADNHALFRREIKRIIQKGSGLKVVGEVGNGPGLFQFLQDFSPHLVILDISLPNLRGMEAMRQIKAENPEVKVLILIWDREPEYLYQSMEAGAAGCLLKEEVEEELQPAIATIRQGGIYLPLTWTDKSFLYSY